MGNPNPRNQFLPGNPGKQKGTRNKRTLEAERWAQGFLKDEKVQAEMLAIAQDPTNEHWQWLIKFVCFYAFGKPVERVHQTSDGSLPSHQFNLAWVDYDQFFVQQELATGQSVLTLEPPEGQ